MAGRTNMKDKTKYCDRCMVRKMTDFYNALDEHEFSEGMPEYQAIVNY